MKIKSVAIGIPVNNLEKSAKWYKDIFEPEEESVPSVDSPIIEYKTGPVWIQLFEGKTENSDNVVNFEVENLEKEYNRLKEMSVINDEEITDILDVIKYL
ncbi:VOC family protein [Pseudoleptotrichia goodfellowii]|uniref:Glyoxalase family protein n=1 Tax=Pseudoleptotrichia goodfellowii TaxID=157692 RepID=A0A510J7I2_9FUSO|nr:VOC family protein [Pseudoleptotrichia goodfellowii]MBF4804997.1 VOC family protein [Pseudoleptotrichia goodfellowii]BBM35114.1 glyoxalase family protein [Pseudoleptotrichia goodfellowii]